MDVQGAYVVIMTALTPEKEQFFCLEVSFDVPSPWGAKDLAGEAA